MSDVVIDTERFYEREARLFDGWQNPEESISQFKNLDALILLAGDQKEEEPYTKTKALQNWLLGYEFPRTLMVLTKDNTLFIAASSKKAQILEQIKSNKDLKIVVLKLVKDPADNENILDPIIQKIKEMSSNPSIGKLVKENQEGKFVDEWNSLLKKSLIEFDAVEVAPLIGTVLAVKDKEGIKNEKISADLTSKMMGGYYIDMMADTLDAGESITHEQLSERVENSIWNSKIRKQAKISDKIQEDDIEWCFNPIIQSGGEYNLSVSAVSDTNALHAGTVICSLGVRYQTYCSMIARTFLIDPPKAREKNYTFLAKLQKHVISLIKPGMLFCDVYSRAVEYIEEKRSDLRPNFVKNIGFATGIEFRDSTFVFSPKCKQAIKSGMTLTLNMGFQKLQNEDPEDAQSMIYALQLCDMLLITDNGAELITKTSSELNDVCFYFNEQDDESEKKSSNQKDRSGKEGGRSSTRTSAILASKFRSENAEEDESQLAKRVKHQKELADKLNSEGLKRFSAMERNGGNQEEQEIKRFESYKRETAIPKESSRLKIFVDERAESIILPINNAAVPFHITTLKNISKSDEGDYVYLRLNFVSPGMGVNKKDSQVGFADSSSTFVRSLTYRSTDVVRMSDIFQTITDLKKDQAKRELQKAQMADIVKQDRLEEIRGSRPSRLNDIYVRPAPEGKRVPGNLEIHRNGVRYVHPLRAESRIDILFNNIKHLIFHPCKHELMVLIHFNLKNPIMIGKKKVYDIQFYREATDASFDETGNRKRRYRYGDEDELEAEQDERLRREKLDREFKAFTEKISEESNNELEMDIPFYEAGFYGVPFRSRVLLQPTVECLVNLTDTPFFIISIADIELAHLERVQFGLKNFDIVFVFKDYKKNPPHVNTVPIEQLDDVKEWLDSVNIPYTEGPVNLNWTQIMKTINDDPVGFFEDGGWSFLQAGDESGNSDSEDAESEFAISEDELEEESESEFSESEAASSSGSEESYSEGEDWDTLERKAEQYDQRHTKSPYPEESRGNPRKGAPRSGGRSNGARPNGSRAAQANKRFRY